jgi:acetylglutamate kinase
VIEVLAESAPNLRRVLDQAGHDGLAYVILDGKIFSADRCGEQTQSIKGDSIDLWYSGKAHHHGGLIQAIFRPGRIPALGL